MVIQMYKNNCEYCRTDWLGHKSILSSEVVSTEKEPIISFRVQMSDCVGKDKNPSVEMLIYLGGSQSPDIVRSANVKYCPMCGRALVQ